MRIFDSVLEHRAVLVADGAWGTELMRGGLPPGEAPEGWNLANPDAVAAVPRAYSSAGADIVLTNSFGGTRFKLGRAGLREGVFEINRRAAAISKRAVGGDALVFGSVGPTGELMAPLGTVGEAEMVEAFAEQIRGLVEGGADGIVVESMTDLNEAVCGVEAANDNSNLPVAATMTFDHGPAGYATMMGVKPEQAAEELSKLSVAAVGSNCGIGMESMVEIIALMQKATHLPLWAKANAGVPQLVAGRTVFREGPEQTAQYVQAIVEAGARVVGGCCGTTPRHIAAIRQEVDRIGRGP